MNFFLDQPEELISYEQLVHVPIDDLLRDCTLSAQIARICRDDNFWYAKIKLDYPEVDIRNVTDPRAFYLRQSTFGGQIYVFDANNFRFDTIDREIIPYDELFNRVNKIAQDFTVIGSRKMYEDSVLGKKYLIIYSAPSTTYQGISYETIACQNKKHVILIPGPARKITLINIIIYDLKEKFIDARARYMISNIARSMKTGSREEKTLQSLSRLSSGLVFRLHSEHFTSVYENEALYVNTRIFEDASINDNFRDEKERLLTKILRRLPEEVFNASLTHNLKNNMDSFAGFHTYDQLVDFQRRYIDIFELSHLNDWNSYLDTLSPNTILIFNITGQALEFTLRV